MHAGLGQPNFPSDDERTLGRYPSRDNPGLDIHSSPLDEEDLASINRRGPGLESIAQLSPHAQQGHQQHPTSPLGHSSSMGRVAGSTAALQLRPPSARMQPSAQPLVPPSGGSMGMSRRNDSSSNTGVGQDLGDGALVAAVAAEGQDGVECSSDGRSLLNPRGSASFQGMSRGASFLVLGGGGRDMCSNSSGSHKPAVMVALLERRGASLACQMVEVRLEVCRHRIGIQVEVYATEGASNLPYSMWEACAVRPSHRCSHASEIGPVCPPSPLDLVAILLHCTALQPWLLPPAATAWT
jgi:hypothetical protein